MAHPFSWPSYLSHEHLIHEPRFDRERDRHLRGHILPPSWSSSDRLFHAPPHRTSSTQPFEPTTSLMPTHPTLALSRKDRKDPTPPTAMPKVTFKAALESLESSNVKAHTFFHKFHTSFNEDVGPKLRVYLTHSTLDKSWAAKIHHHETKSRSQPPQQNEQQHHQNQEDDPTGYARDQSFLELRDELLRRCTNIANLKVPHWPLAALDDLERRNSADALVAKLTASVRSLTPNLQHCDQSVLAMKAALSEMVTIASHLSTHEDAREGEGIRREEQYLGEGEEGGDYRAMTG